MLTTALTLAALAGPLPQPLPSGESHGDLPWFEGTWEEVQAHAASEQKIVFVDFWAEWCGPCKMMFRETFVDERVVAAMEKSFVPYSVDVESDAGAVLAERYSVTALPTFLFLDAKGRALDALMGFVPPDPFLEALARIQKGTDTIPDLERRVAATPDDLDLRLELAQKFQQVGNPEGYEKQLAELKRLDPERKSKALRQMDIQAHIQTLQAELDGAPLRAFLAEETHPELLFEGWRWIGMLENVMRQQATAEGDLEAAKEHGLASYEAMRTAWKHVPQEYVAAFGGELAWFVCENKDELSDEDLRFGLEVAKKAVALAPEDANLLDTLACSYFHNGQREKALATIEQAIELEPESQAWKDRLAQFTKP